MYLQPLLERDIRLENPMVYKLKALGLFFPKQPKSNVYYEMVAFAVQNGLPFMDEPYDPASASRWCAMNNVVMIMFPEKVAFFRRKIA